MTKEYFSFTPIVQYVMSLLVKMENLMSTVLPVYVMMDTLGLIVEVISMSVNYLNQFVMVVATVQTLREVSLAHVQTHA